LPFLIEVFYRYARIDIDTAINFLIRAGHSEKPHNYQKEQVFHTDRIFRFKEPSIYSINHFEDSKIHNIFPDSRSMKTLVTIKKMA
jgi:hypothetical protein